MRFCKISFFLSLLVALLGLNCGVKTGDASPGGGTNLDASSVAPGEADGGSPQEGEGCQPETDRAFCTRLGKNCGEVIDFDNCDASRTVTCGACAAPETCGGGSVPGQCGCSPNCVDKCGGAADGCGGTCTASCPSGQVCQNQACVTCGGVDQPCCANDQCMSGHECQSGICKPICVPNCTGKNCGDDGCGGSCGTCAAPQTCGGGGTPNICGASCTPESDTTFCSRLGKNCGSVTANDNCGNSRTASSCGACTAPATCGGGGTPNVCGTSADTWYDSTSDLTWKINPAGSTLAWENAKSYCTGLGGGWRLPTISELRSLIRGCAKTQTGGACGVTDSCLDYSTCRGSNCDGCGGGGGPASGCYWPSEMNGTCSWFWSSSGVAGYPVVAWYVGFSGGHVFYSNVGYDNFVRCARVGP